MKRVYGFLLCSAVVMHVWAADKNLDRPVSMAGRKAMQRAGQRDPEQERYVQVLEDKWRAALSMERAVQDRREQFPFELQAIEKKIEQLNTLRGLVRDSQKLLTVANMERVEELVKEIRGLQVSIQSGHAPMREFEQEDDGGSWESDLEEIDPVDQPDLVVPGAGKGLRSDEARREMERLRRENEPEIGELEQQDIDRATAASLHDQEPEQEEIKHASEQRYQAEQKARASKDSEPDPLVEWLGEYGIPNVVSGLVGDYYYDTWFNPKADVEEVILKGHTRGVSEVAISEDRSFIVTGSSDGIARIWDAKTGQLLHTLSGHTREVNAVGISHDGRFIVTGSWDGTARIWDAHTGALLHTLSGHTSEVNAVAISQDGKFIVTGSSDDTARIWDAHTRELLHTLSGHTEWVNAVGISRDGSFIVSGSWDGTARVWDAKTGALLHTLSGHIGGVYAVAISRDGSFIVTGPLDGTARVWDAKTGALLHTLSGHTRRINAVGISHDGRFIVTGSDDKTARIWDAKTGELLRTLSGHTREVNAAAISRDGRFIVTGSSDGTARIWDANTGELLHTLSGHTYGINAVGISENGSFIVTGSPDKTARIWRLKGEKSWIAQQDKQLKKREREK